MSFGNRVALIRKERGFSQQELADQIGTGKDIVSRYERNASSPSIEVAAKIARALGVSLDDLVTDVTTDYSDQGLRDLLHEAEKLPEEDRDHLIAVIGAFITKNKVQQILK